MAKGGFASRREAMSIEQRNELNKKRREAYQRKKDQAFNKKNIDCEDTTCNANLSSHLPGTVYRAQLVSSNNASIYR